MARVPVGRRFQHIFSTGLEVCRMTGFFDELFQRFSGNEQTDPRTYALSIGIPASAVDSVLKSAESIAAIEKTSVHLVLDRIVERSKL